jgi:hypothetical protein
MLKAISVVLIMATVAPQGATAMKGDKLVDSFDERWVESPLKQFEAPLRELGIRLVKPKRPQPITPTDVCAKHKMHKVWYGNYWRCRK